MAKRTTKTETAAQAYTARVAEIKAQIATLEARLRIHESVHSDHPAAWDFPGDLGRVKEILAEAIELLGGGR